MSITPLEPNVAAYRASAGSSSLRLVRYSSYGIRGGPNGNAATLARMSGGASSSEYRDVWTKALTPALIASG
jgi:hypothetical protein